MATQCPASFEKRRSGVEMLTTNSPSDKGPDDPPDSGYASAGSTQDGKSSEVEDLELEHRVSRQLFWRFKKTKLRPFDQEISQAVQNRFSDLTELFGPPLYSFLVKRKVKYSAISIKLKVLGKDERSARPWVVVQCDEAASKPIKNFFDQPEVKSQYRPGDSEPDLPSFDVVIHPRAPVSLAASDRAIVYGKSWTDADTLCGNIIKIGSLDKPDIATLGGVIKIELPRANFMMMGLTAGHILKREQTTGHDNGRKSPSTSIYTANSSCKATPTYLKPEIQEVQDRLVHDASNSQDQEDRESATGFELDDNYVEIDQAVEIDTATKDPISFHDSPLDITAQHFQEQSWSRIGMIYSTSTEVHTKPEPDLQSRADQDWALVNIPPHYCRPNLLADQLSGSRMMELTEISGGLDTSEGNRAVVLISGTGGLKRGSLSLSPSFLMLGRAGSFTKTYNLQLYDGLGPNIGDSGSWVVDEQSYGVYGHLVASDALGEIYVVPFDQILLDIKHTLGAVSISLPSQSDISFRRGDYYSSFMGDGLSGHMLDSSYGSENPSPPGPTERASSRRWFLGGSTMVDETEQAHLRGTSETTVIGEPAQPLEQPSLSGKTVIGEPAQPLEQPSLSGKTVIGEPAQPFWRPSEKPSEQPSGQRSQQPSEQPSLSGTTVVGEPEQPISKKASTSIEPKQPVLKRSSRFRRHLKSVFRKVYKPKAESNP